MPTRELHDMSISFPNVPDSLGVPAVARLIGQVTNPVAALVSDAAIVRNLLLGSTWGLYKNGSAVLASASVLEIEYRKGFRIASHPLEQGSFSSYNKVEEPATIRLTVVCDGTTVLGTILGTLDLLSAVTGAPTSGSGIRSSFLSGLDAICRDLDAYQIVMPEFTWPNANVTGYELSRRSERGVSLLLVTLSIQEIRVVAAQGFTATSQPEGADPVNSGAPQPATPTAAQIPPAFAAPDDGAA